MILPQIPSPPLFWALLLSCNIIQTRLSSLDEEDDDDDDDDGDDDDDDLVFYNPFNNI